MHSFHEYTAIHPIAGLEIYNTKRLIQKKPLRKSRSGLKLLTTIQRYKNITFSF